MINLCTPASCGALNRCFSKRPIIARMRKARAFSTPGDMPSCGGGAWALLLNQEDILLCCRQCCLRRRLAQRCIVLQGSRSSRITVCATCASLCFACSGAFAAALSGKQFCSARSARRSGALAGLELVQAIGRRHRRGRSPEQQCGERRHFQSSREI